MRKKIFFTLLALSVMLGLLIVGCNKKNITQQQDPLSVLNPGNRYKVVKNLPSLTETDTVIWYHNDIYTKVTFEKNTDEENETDLVPETNRSSGTLASCSDAFAGSARKTAKTSFAINTTLNGYASINALRTSLPTDAYMRGLGITNSSPRVKDENYNDTVQVSYLYAIARESDNDFHMIIGDSNPLAANLLNCEASGNPASKTSSYTAISAVRSYIKSYFGTDFCGQSGYLKFTPAIPVKTLKGSLFFDIDHAAGTVGPTGLRPNTAWEIHPLQSIKF